MWSRMIQRNAGQGFGGLVCSMCYFVAAEALSKTKNSGSIQIVPVLLTCNSTKPLLLKPITRNCRPSASSKMRGVAMPAASCKFAGTLLTLTKSPTLNVCDVFTSNVQDHRPSERGETEASAAGVTRGEWFDASAGSVSIPSF